MLLYIPVQWLHKFDSSSHGWHADPFIMFGVLAGCCLCMYLCIWLDAVKPMAFHVMQHQQKCSLGL